MDNIYKDNWQGYLNLGLIPFPASSKNKNPIVPWRTLPALNSFRFQEWEKRYPTKNIWVLIGEKYAVIDPDGQGAEEFVSSLKLPISPVSISGNKSTHRWFKVFSALKPLRVRTADGSFIELRTGNQGMLVPPSIHPKTNKSYQWEKGHSPREIPFPELPIEVYEKIKALGKKPEPKIEHAQTENPPHRGLDVKRYLDFYDISYQIKVDGDRTIYALSRCLFAKGHTTEDALRDSGIIQGSDGKLGYHCFHNHCHEKTWHDARKVISKGDGIRQFFKQEQEDLATQIKKAVLSSNEFGAMTFPPRREILAPWLSEQTLTMVSGCSGAGKSWFAYSVSYAITRGKQFGPWQAITPVPCLYIDGEMPGQDIQARIDVLDNLFGEEKEPLYILSDFYTHSLGLPKADLKNPGYREAIKKDALQWGVKLIVLDNLSSLCPGIDENSKQEWDPINQWLLTLRFEGISVMLLHHTSKHGGQRGTSGREDNLDISISLDKPKDYTQEDGCRFIAKFSKHRIKNSDLHLITDTEFHLREEDGSPLWVWGSAKKSRNRAEVLKLLFEGVRQKEIATKIGISPGQVSKDRKALIKQGYLSENDKITLKGEEYLNGNGS